MDPSVPKKAAQLLDLIGNTEAPGGYNVIFGNNQSKLPKSITSMTVNQVIAAGPSWSNQFGSSAAGRYQFITSTLRSLRTSESLSGAETFSANLQDRLGFALLERRGYDRFVAGTLSDTGFGLGLAREWASFPVLADVQGAHRFVRRGQSYYAGDGLNRALITPDRVEAILGGGAPGQMIAAARADARSDKDCIDELVRLGGDDAGIAKAQAVARKAMKAAGLGSTLHNACAATLSAFLNEVGIDVPMTLGAGRLASRLKDNRQWTKVAVGKQQAGDVGVTFDRTAPLGADHIYLVVERKDKDKMIIADNQASGPHTRFASGKGKTPTEYFLRAPDGSIDGLVAGPAGLDHETTADEDLSFPMQDEDTNALVEPFADDGTQVGSDAGFPPSKDGPTPAPAAPSDRQPFHIVGTGIICDTESRGYATPGDRPLVEIVVDASKGFVPLWEKGTTLYWRFQDRSFWNEDDPEDRKAQIEDLLSEAILEWGDAAPIKFSKNDDAWDFEIAMMNADNCQNGGCVLASAFFPDAGRQTLNIYPRMFTQVRREQVETLIHEIGHVFGLRHFFAQVSEAAWPSEIFGTHSKFSIMNYGDDSTLTANDKSDLKNLYALAWSGEKTDVNGTPIRFVTSYQASGVDADAAVAAKTQRWRPGSNHRDRCC